MRSTWSVGIVNIAGGQQERVPEQDIAGIITRSYDMVYFQCKRYSTWDISITVVRIDKARASLIYRFTHGTKEYTVPIHWSRIRNMEHPVQYINVRGSRIWAL